MDKHLIQFSSVQFNTCLFPCWFNSTRANQKASTNIQMRHKHIKTEHKKERRKKQHTQRRDTVRDSALQPQKIGNLENCVGGFAEGMLPIAVGRYMVWHAV